MITDLAPTGTRILDAALTVLGRSGLTRLSLEDVATEAEVSRQTVYRHFGSRDGLLSSLIVREEEAMLHVVAVAAEGVHDLQTAVEVAVAAALHATAEDALLQRVLATEPAALLPFLTLGSGPVLGIVGPAIAEIIAARAPGIASEDLEFLSDLVGRVVVSYAISPRADYRDTALRLAVAVAAHAYAVGATP
jgi:AcrR family transcriptional regulator